jgi:hypothetical protein
MAVKLFGFELRTPAEQKRELKSFVPKDSTTDDGSLTVQSGFYGTYLNLENTAKSDAELIDRYRDMSIHPEVDSAIDDIVAESIVNDSDDYPIKIDTKNLDVTATVKKKIEEEFKNILRLLKFKENGYDIYKSWYVDGRLFYHIIIDNSKPKEGIKELRRVDPRKIKKIREVEKKEKSVGGTEVPLVSGVKEYYIFNDKGVISGDQASGIPITVDSICYVSSGLKDAKRQHSIGHLHKVIKPLNQLRLVEDSVVIYRWTRAPERRVFYIDVGNLPKQKAEQYLSDIMTKYKNKIVYDGNTGEVRDDRKHLSMLEDFWFPRREGGRGTEIETLPGGSNLGEMDDVIYFQKKLYKSLNVPISRLEPENSIQLGRATEISRDEYKFNRFIVRLRNTFSNLFLDLMKKQLILKGVITPDEWENMSEDLILDYTQDSYYTDVKNTEMLRDKITLIGEMEGMIGKYYSEEWVKRNILKMNDEEINDMEKQLKKEAETAEPEPQETDGDDSDDGGEQDNSQSQFEF